MRTRRPFLSVAPLLAVLATWIGLPSAARADEVLLQGGTRLEGVVLERDDSHVRLLLPEGTVLDLAAADVREVVADEDAPRAGEYVRYDERSGGLQVALVHFVHPETGVRVDLVGALHVAEPSFFRQVQTLLDGADTVLYEGVTPEGGTIQDIAEKSDEGVSMLQRKIADLLGLAFQLDAVSYDRPNFLRADLTIEKLNELLQDQGETRDVRDVVSGLGGAADLVKQAKPLLDMITSMGEKMPALRKTLKGLLARALASQATNLRKVFPAKLYDLLVVRRNAAVMEALSGLGADKRRVMVFYGAGHLEDLEARLRERGYVRVGARWLDAWKSE